jgi:ketopantoate reductase
MNKEEKIYHDLLDHVLHLLEHKLPVEMVAAALMAIAQRLYKTHLSEEDYQEIMKVAYETNVEPYDIKKGTLH